MKIRGINYDAGITPDSIQLVTTNKMQEELEVIKNELHCNAVRIYGRDLEKLKECAGIALIKGLAVWFSPRITNASPEETLEYINLASKDAESLRSKFGNLIYVVGNELSLDIKDFLKGESTTERAKELFSIFTMLKINLGSGFQKNLNAFLEKAVYIARKNFKGEITYASGQWEKINWDLFDIASVNYYRNAFNSWRYKRVIRNLVRKNKKFAITEFGCCSYKGAEKRGAWGYSIVDWNNSRPSLKKLYKRDETIQAIYINDLLNLYLKENVYAAFVYTFVTRKSVYDDNPLYDLDMANFGIVKVLPAFPGKTSADYTREKKKSFNKISEFYKSIQANNFFNII